MARDARWTRWPVARRRPIENVLRVTDSKSEDGIRSIAISPTLNEELWQHRRRSNYRGDDERVFCHQTRGTTYDVKVFKTHWTRRSRRPGSRLRCGRFTISVTRRSRTTPRL